MKLRFVDLSIYVLWFFRYINQNTAKIICLYNMLRAHTFRARRKSLRARYADAYEHACNFPRLP